MIKVIYSSFATSFAAETEEFHTQEKADEFMSTVRESGGTIIEWDYYPDEDPRPEQAAATKDPVEACRQALAVFKSHFPYEHGSREIGEAWGALEDAIAAPPSQDRQLLERQTNALRRLRSAIDFITAQDPAAQLGHLERLHKDFDGVMREADACLAITGPLFPG